MQCSAMRWWWYEDKKCKEEGACAGCVTLRANIINFTVAAAGASVREGSTDGDQDLRPTAKAEGRFPV